MKCKVRHDYYSANEIMLIKLEIVAHPGIFPPPADLPRLERLRDFDAKIRHLQSRLWTEIKVR